MDKKRIVIKIGSSSLTQANGTINEGKIADHVAAIASLKRLGHEVILISSGAVAAGYGHLGYASRPVTLKGKQAAAAVGQSYLMQQYTTKFSKFAIVQAQILLTREDFSDDKRKQNADATLSELLERGVVPIINENDTVSVEELTFGDNDMLSALVSQLVAADYLFILTDINGLYNRNPNDDSNAKRFDFIPEITEDMFTFATSTGSSVGTGGMRSKLSASKVACGANVDIIGTGQGADKLVRILHGQGDGTYIGHSTMTV